VTESVEPQIIGPDTTYRLFVMRHRFLHGQDAFVAHYAEHRAFVMEQIACGRMLAGGPTVPWDGGIILICARDRAEAEAFAAGDPIAQLGLTEYEITEWKTTTRADDFTALIATHVAQLPSGPPAN